MRANIDRREFMKRCALGSAGILISPSISRALQQTAVAQKYELCSVVGDRIFENTMKAIEALGGMKKFVQPGNSVGILVNSVFDTPGTFTDPDIPLAVMKMCLDSGAGQIHAINEIPRSYWGRSGNFASMKPVVDKIRYSGEMTEVTVEKGKSLKKADVSKALLACDVYINIPIVKDHRGTRFTCTLKNAMGAYSSSTCRRMHFGESPGLLSLFKGYYSNVEILAQSIADVNLVRQPNLCVVDATEILATNGPSGPGEIRRPREVIAATNCLAADMYAVRHLGLRWEELPMIVCAQQHGYGPRKLEEIKIRAI